MRAIIREIKSIPGLVLGTVVALIITFWVVNLVQTKTPAPISTGASWVFSRATGQAYGAPAAPAVSSTAPGMSPYSMNNNMGPQI